jgi:hypothetical protein
VLDIAALVDATFRGQVVQEIDTFQEVTGRTLRARDATVLCDALYRSMRDSIAGVALGHPSFKQVALELSREGALKLGII